MNNNFDSEPLILFLDSDEEFFSLPVALDTLFAVNNRYTNRNDDLVFNLKKGILNPRTTPHCDFSILEAMQKLKSDAKN